FARSWMRSVSRWCSPAHSRIKNARVTGVGPWHGCRCAEIYLDSEGLLHLSCDPWSDVPASSFAVGPRVQQCHALDRGGRYARIVRRGLPERRITLLLLARVSATLRDPIRWLESTAGLRVYCCHSWQFIWTKIWLAATPTSSRTHICCCAWE